MNKGGTGLYEMFVKGGEASSPHPVAHPLWLVSWCLAYSSIMQPRKCVTTRGIMPNYCCKKRQVIYGMEWMERKIQISALNK